MKVVFSGRKNVWESWQDIVRLFCTVSKQWIVLIPSQSFRTPLEKFFQCPSKWPTLSWNSGTHVLPTQMSLAARIWL